MSARHVAVIDIGKTNAKLAIVDRGTLREIGVVTRPNKVLSGPPWPHFDVEALWDFLIGGLSRFQSAHGVDAISITTHGACAALLQSDGTLAAPILDYEFTGPDSVADAYDGIRAAFGETGSPRLAGGLNLGAQLHWQFAVDPGLKDRVHHVVTYPQYWGHRLTGVASCDVTSLGCHTDLWNPFEGRPSSLVARLGLSGKLAPTRMPGDVLGPVMPHVAEATGLSPNTPVLCGIHDSNASLLPHLRSHAAPFGVVSTGTWVIAMAIGGREVALDPSRDTLVNVNALGEPVRSARFMGGREFDIITAGIATDVNDEDFDRLLESGVMLMPAIVPTTGPFQNRTASWVGAEPVVGSRERTVAASLYLALVTSHCLDLVGQRGPVHVEGPFARNACYMRMLASALGTEVFATGSATGTSQGAALLVAGDAGTGGRVADEPVEYRPSAKFAEYAANWNFEIVRSGSRCSR